MLNQSFSDEIFSYIQPEPHLVELKTISPQPISTCLAEEVTPTSVQLLPLKRSALRTLTYKDISLIIA